MNIPSKCRTCDYKLVREKSPGEYPCSACPSGKEGTKMTAEEAREVLLSHLRMVGMLMPEDWVEKNGDGSRFMQAYEMALDALKGQEKERAPLFYSHRKKLSEKFMAWAIQKDVAVHPISVVTWLAMEGLIDLGKAHAMIGEE